jgi:anti-sigma factor ChrR (cupin superfamily)
MSAQDLNMPTHDDLNERLSDYLDNELDAAGRAAVEAHLAGCGECRADLEALAAVVARAGTLADRAPEQNLWPGVEARVTSPQVLRPTFSTRRFAFTMPQLIAASLALMIASGGMVWLARLGGDRTDLPAVMGEVLSPVRPANFGDAAFDQAVADLQQTLDEGRGRLDAQTIRILETNLQAIDRAITQCREALAADPANVYLNTYLAETRRRKLELLRRATALVDQSST